MCRYEGANVSPLNYCLDDMALSRQSQGQGGGGGGEEGLDYRMSFRE